MSPGVVLATRGSGADLWHAHFPNPLADLACLLGRRDVPLVVSYHSDVIRQAGVLKLYAPILNRVLSRADSIVVATPKHIEHSPWLRPLESKCRVIPFGIKLDRFALEGAREEEALKLREGAVETPIFLNIGRMVGYKGQQYLLEAARKVPGEFWFVGGGPLENDLKTQARRVGLGGRVRFWGSVDDEMLPLLLNACDVFVLPSITPNEAFGLVQIEAMACGKPVVCCELASGVPFVNQHGVTGLVVPPANSEALAEALNALGNDAPRRKTMGEAGRARAQAEFSEGVMLGRYWQLFHELTGVGNPS